MANTTTTTTTVTNKEYDFFTSPYNLYDLKNQGILHLEKQIKSLAPMLSTIKHLKENLENPVARQAIDRMEDVMDEFRDVIEEMVGRLSDMQDRANYFAKLEDEAWQIEMQEYPED